MFRVLETAHSPSAALAQFYRFALLLSGDPEVAEQIVADTLLEAESQLAQLRRPYSRHAWLAKRIRERCLKQKGASATPPLPPLADSGLTASLAAPDIDAVSLARCFETLPEPGRTALALFYLDFFTIEEIAQFLKMDAGTLSQTLGDARGLLDQALRANDAVNSAR